MMAQSSARWLVGSGCDHIGKRRAKVTFRPDLLTTRHAQAPKAPGEPLPLQPPSTNISIL